MTEIETYHNILTEEEKNYLYDLIKDNSKWEYRTEYNQVNEEGKKWAWFDSIRVDYEKLKNYHNFICENGKYTIGETALNIITKDRQNNNSTHYDNADVSFSTYLEGDYIGGDFIYYDHNKEKKIIKPITDLTLKINSGVLHAVDRIVEGKRYSLYSFLFLKRKNNKSLL